MHMEKCTEVQCRVQYLSTNADALVTHNPTKAQSIPSPQQVPCAPSSQGQVWYPLHLHGSVYFPKARTYSYTSV